MKVHNRCPNEFFQPHRVIEAPQRPDELFQPHRVMTNPTVPDELFHPNGVIKAPRRPVGTRGVVGRMRGPCACPCPDDLAWNHHLPTASSCEQDRHRHESIAATTLARLLTASVSSDARCRPLPFPASTPCPYRSEADVPVIPSFGWKNSSGIPEGCRPCEKHGTRRGCHSYATDYVVHSSGAPWVPGLL